MVVQLEWQVPLVFFPETTESLSVLETTGTKVDLPVKVCNTC